MKELAEFDEAESMTNYYMQFTKPRCIGPGAWNAMKCLEKLTPNSTDFADQVGEIIDAYAPQHYRNGETLEDLVYLVMHDANTRSEKWIDFTQFGFQTNEQWKMRIHHSVHQATYRANGGIKTEEGREWIHSNPICNQVAIDIQKEFFDKMHIMFERVEGFEDDKAKWDDSEIPRVYY